jgi:hypothetical protein
MSQLSSSSWSTSGYGVTLGKIFIPSIAQLEERETVIGNIRAHLKVTGSIPVRGIIFCRCPPFCSCIIVQGRPEKTPEFEI